MGRDLDGISLSTRLLEERFLAATIRNLDSEKNWTTFSSDSQRPPEASICWLGSDNKVRDIASSAL